MCLLQTGEEIRRSRASGKVAVGILPWRQGNDAGLQAGTLQAMGEEARSLLASLVGINVEGDIDTTAVLITELGPLRSGQVSADSRSGVPKTSLPERG